MSLSIHIRPAARRDLDRHADSIGRNSRAAGRRFYEAAQQALAQLAAMPEMGALCELENPRLAGLRMWTIRGFENYLIFYLPTEETLTLVRVLHGAQDIESIFEREE